MADQLNMGNLSLGPSPVDGQPGARSYIPPHMRNKMMNGGPPPQQPPPPVNGGGLNSSAWK